MVVYGLLFGDLCVVGLEVGCQFGQIGCVQCGGFGYLWVKYWYVKQVVLELCYEVVGDCIVVGVQFFQFDVGIGLYCGQYVVGLVGY